MSYRANNSNTIGMLLVIFFSKAIQSKGKMKDKEGPFKSVWITLIFQLFQAKKTNNETKMKG